MKNTIDIKFEEINIADEHLNAHDEHYKSVLWSVYNIIKRTKKNAADYWEDRTLSVLYEIAKRGSFKDDEMNLIELPEGEKVYLHATTKKAILQSGFAISNRKNKLGLSYKLDDFDDVILGLKFFVDICEKYDSEGFANNFFLYGDISIAFEGVDINKNEKVIKEIRDFEDSIEGGLARERLSFLSADSKAFIVAFNEKMNEIGYDYGDNNWWVPANDTQGINVIIYSKTGIKSKNPFARIHLYEDKVDLRMYFQNINDHSSYIENAPQFIKDAFVFEGGDCKKTSPDICVKGCKSMKAYTIGGQDYVKCCHYPGHFHEPTIERLPEYIALLTEFYPKLKR